MTQDDVLTWTLTVREAIYLSAQLQLPYSMPLLEKKQRADTMIKEMGLHDAIDTRIGGWGNKRPQQWPKEEGQHLPGDLASSQASLSR